MILKAQVSGGKRPLLFVFSGPSGVGKDAVLAQLKSIGKSMRFVVTTTTRPKREVESNGVHYDFVSRDKFEGMIKKKGAAGVGGGIWELLWGATGSGGTSVEARG